MWVIFTAFLCSVAFCTATRQESGICSKVHLISQYCSDNDVTLADGVTVARGPVGKAGIPGQPGPQGLPGIVNYTQVEEKIASKIKEVEKKFESKFEEYETFMNKTVSNLEKKIEAFAPEGCHEVKVKNMKEKNGNGGVFDIHLRDFQAEVLCDLTTDSGKWTVFQRRFDGSQDFDQDWSNYAAGFGNLTGEFWLGLEKIHLLTQGGTYELRVEMTDQNDRIGIAKYQSFSVSGSSENYRLNVGGFSGTGVSDQLAYHNNMAFTTKDRDNDRYGDGNCAVLNSGGWWYDVCANSMLNKPYGSIFWGGFSNIKKTEMKFRKK